MEDLNAAALDDVREWFKTYYGPQNAVLVVAGDVRPEDVKARVEKYFGDIPPGPPIPRHEAWIARRSGEQRQLLEDRVPQARIYKVWNGPAWGAQDGDDLDLAAAVLASGKTSRLWKRLVYDDQLATDVAAFNWTAEIGSRFIVQATARPGTELAKLEKALDEELARLLADGPTPDEVERLKTDALSGFVRGLERIGGFGGKSDVLAEHTVYGGRPDAWQDAFARTKAATAASVGGAAKAWLSDGAFVLEVRPFPNLATAKTGADRKTRPEPGVMPEGRLPAFQRSTLKNGLKVIVAERHAVPTVTARLLVDAGYSSDSADTAGLARLAADMMDEGTKTRNALQISEELQKLGASLQTFSDGDMTVVGLSALKTALDPALGLMADVVVNPSFPASDFERQQRQQLAAIEQEGVRPDAMALRVLPKLVFGAGHAYATPATGSGYKATVAKLTREDAARWHASWIRPGSSTLIVVGDTTLAEIAPRLEAAFAAWPKGAAPRKNLPLVEPRGPASVYLLDRPGALQSVIVAGQAAPPRNNPQEIAQAVANMILGGQFISRVNMNLREDKHWSYGARTQIADARGPRPFVATAPVQTDKTKESVAELAKELKGIRGQRPITADELQAAQSALTLTLPGRWETSAAVAGSLAEIVRFGFDDRYFEGYAAKVRAVTLADASSAAKLVQPDKMIWVIAGDRAKIEAGIRELALGKLQVIDADGNLQP